MVLIKLCPTPALIVSVRLISVLAFLQAYLEAAVIPLE